MFTTHFYILCFFHKNLNIRYPNCQNVTSPGTILQYCMHTVYITRHNPQFLHLQETCFCILFIWSWKGLIYFISHITNDVNISGRMITNDIRCINEIKSRTDIERSAFNKKDLFTSKRDLTLGNKLVNHHIWSISLLKTWTLQKVHQKYLGSTEMWRWRRIEKISGTNCVKHDVLQRVKNERNILHTIKRKRLTRLVKPCTENTF